MVEAEEGIGAGGRDASAGSREASALRASLAALSADAQRLPIAEFEYEDAGSLEPLFAHTERVLGEASEVYLRILEHYEAIETQRRSVSPPVPLDALMTSIDEALEDDDDGVTRIASIAFLGRLGVRERGAALRGGRQADRWEAVDLLGSALREVGKASTALDIAIAEIEGLPVGATYFVSEVDRALDTRRAYRRLREDIVADGDPSAAAVVPRLRRAAAAIAKLVGRPVYAHLRTRDRHQLRTFQRRIVAYLVGLGGTSQLAAVSDFAARDGQRLHRDLANLTELMMQVNHRVELRGHDATIASALAHTLRREPRGDAAMTPEALRAALLPLEGRSSELDHLLAARRELEPIALAELLERIVADVDGDGGVRRSFVMPTRRGSTS